MSETPDSAKVGAVTPKMRRQDRRRAIKHALRHRLTCLWGRTGYRPWQRLLHRMNLHHTRTSYVMGDECGEMKHVRCDWCGLTTVTQQHYSLRLEPKA